MSNDMSETPPRDPDYPPPHLVADDTDQLDYDRDEHGPMSAHATADDDTPTDTYQLPTELPSGD